MSVTKPRNRLLIFRLTQEEYATLQTASSERGARSLSEFARAQLFGSLDTPALGEQLGELKTTVTRIAQMLERNRWLPDVRSNIVGRSASLSVVTTSEAKALNMSTVS